MVMKFTRISEDFRGSTSLSPHQFTMNIVNTIFSLNQPKTKNINYLWSISWVIVKSKSKILLSFSRMLLSIE